MKNLNVRRLALSDGLALKDLSTGNSDIGLKRFSYDYLVDPIDTFSALHDSFEGVVLEQKNKEALVAGGLINYGNLNIGNESQHYGMLSSMVVNQKYKWQGIQKVLLKELLRRIKEKIGPDGMVYTILHPGSKSALQTNWHNQIISKRIVAFPTQMRANPVNRHPDYSISPLDHSDLNHTVDLINDFYKDYEMFAPKNYHSFNSWLDKQVEDHPINHYWVVKDKNNNILSGIGLTENFRVRQIKLKGLPITKTLNLFVKLIPKEGAIRELAANMFWYLPGQEEAAIYLWESIRHQWREKANTLMIYLDANSPITPLINPERWKLDNRLDIALKGSIPLNKERLIYFEPI